VLSPYSWAAEDDQALLAMDLVGGGSVSSLVADFGALPERYAAELLAQLLGALDQVHASGLLHRDIKPANLLLETTGTGPPVLRLSDFGIALSLGEPRLTQDGAVVGTPGYVAPEALAGEPPSISQDLYAVGVTGWQLLTGAEPPAAGPPPSRPLDTAAESIIWRVVEDLMLPEPANRTHSAKEALAALAPLLAKPLILPALTLDGEPIEVFNQLPPLPKPYSARAVPPEVPAEPSRALTEPPVVAADPGALAEPPVVPTKPREAPAEPEALAEPPVVPTKPREAPAERPVVPAQAPEVAADPGALAEPPVVPAEPPGVPAELSEIPNQPTPAESGTPSSARRRTAVLAASGVAVVAVAAVIAILTLDGPPAGKESPPPSQQSTPKTIPTGPITPAPNAAVKLGGACGWQEAGNLETTADGIRITCRQQGSSYRWIKAG
jgi:serine/threonine-protein kinase